MSADVNVGACPPSRALQRDFLDTALTLDAKRWLNFISAFTEYTKVCHSNTGSSVPPHLARTSSTMDLSIGPHLVSSS